MKSPKITDAYILAVGGITSSLLVTIGGFVGVTDIVGAAGTVMLFANVLVLTGRWS